MIRATLELEFRRARGLLVWLVIIAVAYGGLLSGFYPTIRANAAKMQDFMNIYPAAFRSAFGMEGSLADPGVFFSVYNGSMLWPIVAAVAAIILATRPVGVDLDRGWIDLPLSTPLPRVAYLGISILLQLVVLAVVSVTMIIGILVCGAVVGAGFDTGRFLLVIVPATTFGVAIAGVTTLFSVITLDRRVAGGAAAGVMIAMYLANLIAKLQPDLADLARVSIFHYFNSAPVIDQGVFPTGDVLLLGGIGLVGWLASLWVFRRRDLAA